MMLQNIVLIGMPCSGKTTIGRMLAERLECELIDTDDRIVERAGMPITEIFRLHGEAHFRELEARVVHESALGGCGRVIATGGGSILRRDNVSALCRTGMLIFLDRPLDELIPADDRPLADNSEKIRELHRVRHPLYMAVADCRVAAGGTPEDVLARVLACLDCAERSAS